jgi:hypothetical protein
MSVRNYFYALYNATNATFREMLVSVGNKDSKTGNRLFDRHVAVGMVKEAAKRARGRALGRDVGFHAAHALPRRPTRTPTRRSTRYRTDRRAPMTKSNTIAMA